MNANVTGLMISAIVFFIFGVHMIMQAERMRRGFERSFDRHGFLHRFLLFGDWILRFPRAHVVWIRMGGLVSVLVALLCAFLAFASR